MNRQIKPRGKSTFIALLTGKIAGLTLTLKSRTDIRAYSSKFLEFDPSAKRVDFSNITPV